MLATQAALTKLDFAVEKVRALVECGASNPDAEQALEGLENAKTNLLHPALAETAAAALRRPWSKSP